MKEFKADLHLHTCLSPCCELEMIPTAIIVHAKKAGLDMIAICDHNSAENVAAVVKAGKRENFSVVPGIEITSSEEVHIIGLFERADDLLKLQNVVYENLLGENDEESFGLQIVVDENNELVDKNERLLIGATNLTTEQIVERIHKFGGLAIASHIDRESYSIIGQLGFIPEGLRLDALEVSYRAKIEKREDYPVITSSDAHFLTDIGKCYTRFWLEEANFGEIKKALRGQRGRCIITP